MDKPSDPVGDPWPEEETTRVDRYPVGENTPVVSHRCLECGGDVLTDDFDVASLAGFPADRCVRGVFGKWHSCFRLRKAVFYW